MGRFSNMLAFFSNMLGLLHRSLRALRRVRSWRSPRNGRLVLALGVLVFLAAPVLLAAKPRVASAACDKHELRFKILAEGEADGILGEGGLIKKEASSLTATRAELLLSSVTPSAGEVAEPYEWKIELSSSKSGPYTLADSGQFKPNLGEAGEKSVVLIRKLAPTTTYYARAVIHYPCAAADEVTTEFTTSPVGPPEATALHSPEHEEAPFVGTTFAHFRSEIETNGAQTEYDFEDATTSTGPWTPVPGCAGTITVAQEFGEPECAIEGLSPETTYYVRLVASNEHGTSIRQKELKTITAKPRVCAFDCSLNPSNVTSSSATLHERLRPDGLETQWLVEYATSAQGPWISGPQGVIPAAEADEREHGISAELTGLAPEKTYYLRFLAKNAAGSATIPVATLETAGASRPAVYATHTFVPGSETPRVLGLIAPHDADIDAVQSVTLEGSPTGGTFTLGFEGETTEPIPFNATDDEVGDALARLAKLREAGLVVTGPFGGPYKVEFTGKLAGVDVPQLTGSGSGLLPSGSVSVATLVTGAPAVTHYHLEYIAQEQLEEPGGWSHASRTEEQEFAAGPGEEEGAGQAEEGSHYRFATTFVSTDLAGAQPGKTYHYRVVSSNAEGAVTSAEQTLRTPAPAAASPEPCPNEAFRTGPSLLLPDCRAYEQVTPANKEGTVEVRGYGGVTTTAQELPDPQGDRFFVETGVSKWGTNVGGFFWSYLFSRGEHGRWNMTPVATQPQAGPASIEAELHSADLTDAALSSGWTTGPGGANSPEITLQAGPFGGPYSTVASMPRKDVPGEQEGVPAIWLAASADFSKLVFQSKDRKLLGSFTGTDSGPDLYEYSRGGGVRQLNIDSSGATIGTCGARIVNGREDSHVFDHFGSEASAHAVSADGSRVFFEAVSGSDCSAPRHLYVRVEGSRTLDLGQREFIAADASGTKLLLRSAGGGELLLYDLETQSAKRLLTGAVPGGDAFLVSEDFSTLYILAGAGALTPEAPKEASGQADLYSVDIASGTIHFIAAYQPEASGGFKGALISPNGRSLYFESQYVQGVVPPAAKGHPQIYTYDSGSNTIECVSCASPYDPEPTMAADFLLKEGGADTTGRDNVPVPVTASANGDYVFFETLSALVPQDADGEIAPSPRGDLTSLSFETSPSSDIYEWRRDNVDGCVHAQGCLSMISSPTGGYFVGLLGVSESGRDVFFTSDAQLGPNDDDTALDVYDARIGGGEAPQQRPSECEGDACFSPAPTPNDTTPASLTFSGVGSVFATPPTLLSPRASHPAPRRCRRGVARHRRRCVRVRHAKKPKKRARSGRRGRKARR